MKKSITLATVGLLVFFFFYACKKNTSEIVDKALEERSLAALKEKIPKDGIPITIATNVRSESFLSDADGNRLTDFRTLTACQDGNGEDIVSFDESIMEDCQGYYDCQSLGFKVKTTWKIVTELPLLSSNSKGKVRIKNGSGTILFTNANITPVTITILPETDPNFPNSTVYSLVYESPVIDENHFINGGVVENSVQVNTNCGYTLPIQYLTTNTVYWNSINTDPCLRIDKVYINPPTYDGSGQVTNLGSYAGVNIFGYCLGGAFILPEYQHLKFSNLTTGTIYLDFNITPYTLATIPNGTIPKGTNVKLEYWNLSFAVCTPPYMVRTEIYNNW